jgi:hypothetical protein
MRHLMHENSLFSLAPLDFDRLTGVVRAVLGKARQFFDILLERPFPC